MCGITGAFAFNEIGRLSLIHLSAATDRLSHRGPDAGKLYTDYSVGLGHRRLSVIDLTDEANQPMSTPDGRYVIVFNGEIYNYQQLRAELVQSGHQFRTQSDTEVLLYMYVQFGAACLPRLHGFFAFAIYDTQEQHLFIARDRFGIKPLCYYLDEDRLLFASEISSLLAYRIPRVLDPVSVFQYFQFHYIPAPQSIFQNVYKLLPGHWLSVRKKQVESGVYYTLPLSPAPEASPAMSYEQAQKQLVSLMEGSVAERMVADVPLGAFLSGGIDSSVVTALASGLTPHLNTFSVGYQDSPMFDETHYANLVAKKFGTNHTVFRLRDEDFFQHIEDILGYFGEPFADSSAIPFYILSKRTREKVTVALSGDGADELFAGYHRHAASLRAEQPGWSERGIEYALPFLAKLPKNRNSFLGNRIRQLHRFGEAMPLSSQERYWYLSSWRAENQVRNLFTDSFMQGQHACTAELAFQAEEYASRKANILSDVRSADFNSILRADIKLLLPNDMLHKVDMMSMAHALEVRVPFLDHRVVNFACSLPANYKIDRQMKKKILQDAFRHILPKELYKRPKHGFDVPLMRAFKGPMQNWIEKELFHSDFIENQGIFRDDQIAHIQKMLLHSTNFDQNQVWALIAFQSWWKSTCS